MRPARMDGRLFLSSYLPTVEGVEAHGRDGRVEIINRANLPTLFRKDEIRLGLDPSTSREIVVLREAYEERRFELYRHESASALRIIEANHSGQLLEKELFKHAETLVFTTRAVPKNLRHISFMLKAAAQAGADYLAAAAIMVHNLEDTRVRTELLAGRKSNPARVDAVEELLQIKRLAKHLIEIPYLPPTEGKMPQYYIQNFMNALIKLSEGRGRALLICLVHHYSNLIRRQTLDPLVVRSVEELLAPLAERFGRIGLAQGLRNEAFRISNPELYLQIENDLAYATGLSREEGQLFLDLIAERLRASKILAGHFPILVKTRYKLPWEAQKKTENKPVDYPDVIFLQDILGATAVTETPLTLKTAMDVAQEAAGEDFESFNFADRQTETKRDLAECHHVSVKLKGGKFMEFQFMDRKSFEIRERGEQAHFIYKLPRELDQVFDAKFLESCRQVMNGDFNHDVLEVFNLLRSWTYVFFFDQRFNDQVIRVLRRRKGCLPIEVVPVIVGKDLSNYGGIRVKKVWEWKEGRFNNLPDDRELLDGDLVEVKIGAGLSRKDAARLFLLAKHTLTRLLLFYYNREKSKEEDARLGENLLRNLARKRRLSFNRVVLTSYAFSHRLTLEELFAACRSKIIDAEVVLQVLASNQKS
ncbi:hypothetical protein HZC35_00930 [Candidatus Saganbacteria bacterium]|nr:hypothetical protein [Candidatus Saganbacteria bacterium]